MTRYGWTVLLTISMLLVPLTAGAAEEPYIIGPEDVLDVQVWDNKDLNQVVFVRPDGKTSLPLLGEVDVANKTVQKVQDELTALYAKSVKVPSVTVIIKEIRSRPVFFVGGFGKPGVLQLTRDLNLVQAVAILGGLAPSADAERGYLLRGDKRVPIDFYRMIQKGDLSQNVKLEPGDTVVAPLADVVYVEGEVRRAGPIKYTSELTVVKAVAQAGGFTQLAAPGRVDILRVDGAKKVRIRIDVDKMLRAPDENPDMALRPDDIIFVPQRFF